MLRNDCCQFIITGMTDGSYTSIVGESRWHTVLLCRMRVLCLLPFFIRSWHPPPFLIEPSYSSRGLALQPYLVCADLNRRVYSSCEVTAVSSETFWLAIDIEDKSTANTRDTWLAVVLWGQLSVAFGQTLNGVDARRFEDANRRIGSGNPWA